MHRRPRLNQILSRMFEGSRAPRRHPAVARSALMLLASLSAGLILAASGFAQSSPVAFYSLNGNTTDTSGNGFNGTVNGSSAYAAGLFGQQAFSFDGNTTIGTTTTDNLGIYNGSFTVDEWVNLSSITSGNNNSEALFGTNGTGNDLGLQLLIRNDNPFIGFYGDDAPGGNSPIAANTWYNVAFTFDATTKAQTMYVNGVQVGQGTATNNFQGTGQTALIGGSCCGADPTGLIQDVGVYNTALSQAQIQAQIPLGSLTWTGGGGTSGNGSWDSTASTANWVDANSTATSYADGDFVTFDDTGANTNITVQSPSVNPFGVVFNNTAAGNTYTFTNAAGSTGIGGTAAVTVNGTGTVIFNSPNTYTGATTINNGVLRINDPNSLQNSTATVNVNSAPSPATGLVFGPGVGTFNLGGLAGTGNLAMTDTASQPVNLVVGSNGANTIYSGNLTGGGSFTKTGSGILTLSGTNSYAGPTFITQGTLRVASGVPGLWTGLVVPTGSNNPSFNLVDPISHSQVSLTTATIANNTNAGLQFPAGLPLNSTIGYTGYINNPTNGNVTYTFAENFDDGVALSIDGVTVLQDDTYNNPTMASYTLTPGAHAIQLRFGQGTGGVGPVNGGLFNGENGGTTVATTNGNLTTYVYTAPVGGAVNSDPDNIGFGYTTDIGSTDPGQYVNLLDTGSGSLLSTGAGLQAIPTTSSVIMSSGTTFDVSTAQGPSVTIGSLADASGPTPTNQQVFLGNTALITGNDNSDTIFSGVISGAGNLTKIGSGTFTLAGQNNYTGGTTVNTGTVVVSPTGALGPGSLRVNAAGIVTLQNATQNLSGLAGTGTINLNGGTATNLTVTGGPSTFGGLIQGSSGSGLTVSSTGNLTLTNTNLANTYSGGTAINGTLNLTSSGNYLGTGTVNIGAGGNLNLVAGIPGLAGQFSANFSNSANFNTLSALQAHFASFAPGSLVLQNSTANSVDPAHFTFGTSGTGFPAPFNSGTPQFEGYWQGVIDITSAGQYTFGLDSDDGSMLFIDGATVVSNNFGQGISGGIQQSGTLNLSAGFHTIDVGYYNSGGGYGFETFMNAGSTVANSPDQLLSNSILFTAPTVTTNISGLSGTGTVNLTGLSTLQIGIANSSSSFGGAFTGGSLAAVTITGGGTLTLTGNSSTSAFTSPITVSNGTLRLANGNSGSATGGAPIIVGDQGAGNFAVLTGTGSTAGAVTVNGPGASGNAGTIVGTSGSTLSLTGGLTLQTGSISSFSLGTPNGTLGNALIATSGGGTGSMVIASGSTISFTTPQAGTYDLYSYTGAGPNSGNLTLNPASIAANANLNFLLINNSGENQIDLIVTNPPIFWTGASSNWMTSATPDGNWVTGDGTPTSYNADNGTVSVTFADTFPASNTAVGSTNVVIQAGGITPATVAFTNSATNYTLSDGDSTNGIMGTASISLSGTGTVTFTSPNSFTGPVSINAGQLRIENSGALGTAAGVAVASGAALQLQGGLSVGNIPLSISGTGLAGNANGALQSVSGNNSYAGAIDLGTGAVITSSNSGDTLTLTGGITNNGNQVNINGAGNTTISTGPIAGAGGLIYNGSGVLTLNAASTYSGGTTLPGGTIRVGASSSPASGTLANGALGTGLVTLNGGTLQDNGSAITLGNSVSLNGNLIFSSSGAGGLTFDGTGLSTPATFDVAGTSSLAVNNTTTINDAISGSSDLAVSGTGTLQLGGSNSYSGGTTINSGVVQINNSGALQNSVVTLNSPGGLTFNTGIGSVRLGGLSGSTNLALSDLGSNPLTTLTLGNSNSVGSSSGSYSGILSGSATTLTKVGSNTQTLTSPNGSNSFAAINVAGGTLASGLSPATNSPLGSAPITLSNGGTLALQGQIGLLSGLEGFFYNNAPTSINNSDPDYANGLAALNTHFASLTPAVIAATSAGGYQTLDFHNNDVAGGSGNYGSSAPFGTNPANPSQGQANFGFTSTANYEVKLAGQINIATPGTYTFSTTSDDGSMLYIDGMDAAVVSNNAFQGATTQSGTFDFTTAGSYAIEIGYYQGTGGQGLLVQYSGPDTADAMVTIPNSVLQATGILDTQTYANNVLVTSASTINVSTSPNAIMGTLSINGSTLNVTGTGAYSLTLGATSLTGSPTFNVPGSTGTLVLGPLNDNPGNVGSPTPQTITLTGPGSLTLNSPATSLVQGTVININNGTPSTNSNGTLNSNATGALGSFAQVFAAGTLNVGANQTISSLSGPTPPVNPIPLVSYGGSVRLGNNTLTIGNTDNASATNPFAGVISDTGSGAIVINGGVQKFTGANTYQGGTTIAAGTLRIGPFAASNATTPLSTGLVTLSGGTLALQGQTGTQANAGLTNYYFLAGSNGIPVPVANNGNNGWTAVQSPASIASTFGPLTPAPGVFLSTNNNGGTPFTTYYYGGSNNNGLNNFVPNTNGNVLNGGGGNGTNFTLISVGNVNTPVAGNYTFGTTSDDGSMLFIYNNGAWQTVVNNNKMQGANQVVGTIDLSAGAHPIEIAYYEGGGGYVMSAQGEYDPDQSTPPTSLPNPTDPANNGVNSFLPSPLDLQYSADPGAFGLQYNTPITNTTQLYGNNVSVTSNSDINVTGSLAATMGDLSINGSTLGLASDDESGSPYSLTLGFTTLTGNATFNVANSAGGGAGTLVLGPVSDLGNGFGITVSGGGTLELAAANTYSGPTNVNSGRLLIDAGASIQSTAITVGMGGTLQLAGTTHALPSAANITTKGSGLATDGAVTLTGSTAESIGTITGDASTVDGATVYAGNTTVGDGTNAASLTAIQILQNTLTINAGSTVTIAPSAGAGGGVVAVASSASAASSTASADSSGGSDSDPFTAIQDAIAAGSISSVKGQQLENRIAAIERLAATDPALDVSLLESHVLAALPSSSVLSTNNSSPLGNIDSDLLAVDSSTFASGSDGATATFASDAGVIGSPAAVPEPSTILLLILGGIVTLPMARRKFRR